MAQLTEAACLLQTGAMYPFRRGLRPADGEDIFLGIKPGAFSIYFGDAPIYHFDLEGRWQRAFIEGVHYLKSLDTTVQAIDRVREGENLILKRRALGPDETRELDARIRSVAVELASGFGGGLASIDPPEGVSPIEEGPLFRMLDAVAARDENSWAGQRDTYLSAYGPIPFLPPDTSSPVILQATLGEANGVGFGGGQATPYRSRSIEDFAEHVRTVAGLVGRRALQCRQLFLAGHDALRRPAETILAELEVAARAFSVGPSRARPRARDVDVLNDPGSLDGFHAFLHQFDREPFSEVDWSRLRDLHFRRPIFGLESGSARVRSLYGRDWPDEGLRAWVASCPVEIGLVIVVGSGGIEGAEEHVERTVELVGLLAMPAGSLVSLVDQHELDSRPDADRGFTSLDAASLSAQRAEMKARLGAILAPRKVKVTTYSTEKRWR